MFIPDNMTKSRSVSLRTLCYLTLVWTLPRRVREWAENSTPTMKEETRLVTFTSRSHPRVVDTARQAIAGKTVIPAYEAKFTSLLASLTGSDDQRYRSTARALKEKSSSIVGDGTHNSTCTCFNMYR